jgi:hypothetical protein
LTLNPPRRAKEKMAMCYQVSRRSVKSSTFFAIAAAIAGICPVAALATDISGVLPAAADQPQIHVLLNNAVSNGNGGYTPGSIVQVDDGFGDTVYDIQGFLDTGTSGILLSQETQQGLNVNLDSYKGQPVTFDDVAVGGTDQYWVSTPYYLSTASFNVNNDVEAGSNPPDISQYTPATGAVRMQVNQQPADELIGPLDIFGMPVMEGKIATFDIRAANDPNQLAETKTYLYAPSTPFKPATLDTDPGIVTSQYHVKLSYADFSQFTQTGPPGVPASYTPQQDPNPMIGPDPVRLLNTGTTDNTPPISISYGGHSTTGSFLFDTGAQASFISTALAANLHIQYATDSSGNQLLDANGDPYLISTDAGHALIPNQFAIPITGAGGNTIDAAGFYLDQLSLATEEGSPINFLSAPVLVTDITVQDPVTNKTLTLDGDFGMNFIEPSMSIDGSQSAASPFNFVTFDQPNGTLDFTLNSDTILPNDLVDGTTMTVSSDGAIGTAGSGVSFSGGALQVTSSFTTTRPLSINSSDGEIDIAPSQTLTLSPISINWAGGTLSVVNTNSLGVTATVAFALSAGSVVTVAPNTVLSISAGTSVIVNGSKDPFTDSAGAGYHVSIVNDGSFILSTNSSVSGIVGSGTVVVGNGSAAATLQIAANSVQSTTSSLTIKASSVLDVTNNSLIVNYTGTSPVPAIISYLHSGYNGGLWNGAGITSSTAAASRHYGVGFYDGALSGNPSLTSNQIEIAYALYGDITLAGTVSGTDFGILAAHFGKRVTGGWEMGDFTYQGVVSATDFGLLAANFGKTASGTSIEIPQAQWAALDAFAASHNLTADLPDPGAAGFLIISAIGLAKRRRSSKRSPQPAEPNSQP